MAYFISIKACSAFVLTDKTESLRTYGYWVGRDGLGVWVGHVHTAILKIDNQQEPTVYHRELCPIFCNNLNGKRI